MNEYMMERNLKEVPSVVPHAETQTNIDTEQPQTSHETTGSPEQASLTKNDETTQ